MRSLPLIVAIALTACASASQPTGELANNGTPQGAGNETQPATDSRKDDFVGRWMVTLPPKEVTAIAVARFALADPPNRAAFEAMNPAPEDVRNFENLIRLRTEEPDSPLLARVREKLEALDAMALQITPNTIEFGIQRQANKYRVLSERDGVLAIEVENDDNYDVIFVDDDHIEMRNTKGTRLPFTRVGAESKRSAANAPVARSDAGSAPAPSKAGPAGDSCEAYARCVEQMPRLKGDEAVMGGSANAIRSFEKTPDQLKQCKSAHEMARVAGLCP